MKPSAVFMFVTICPSLSVSFAWFLAETNKTGNNSVKVIGPRIFPVVINYYGNLYLAVGLVCGSWTCAQNVVTVYSVHPDWNIHSLVSWMSVPKFVRNVSFKSLSWDGKKKKTHTHKRHCDFLSLLFSLKKGMLTKQSSSCIFNNHTYYSRPKARCHPWWFVAVAVVGYELCVCGVCVTGEQVNLMTWLEYT